MLNPADTKVTEMKLSPLTLEMHDLIVEKQFLSLHLQPSLNNLRLFTVLLLSYFVIYCLTDYFIGG
jgi:phospholipid-translocating ATPase